MISFVKVLRSEQSAFLDHYPNANHLLNVIARRARRTKCDLNQLEIGECFISFRSVGLAEQQYRTAKKQLQKWSLVEFKKGRKVTDKGTVALLLNSLVYDINTIEGNGSITEVKRKANASLTTNKECNNDNNVKKNNIHQQIADSWNEMFKDELPLVSKITQKRKSAINGCIAEMKGTNNDFSRLETWTKLFAYAKSIGFLMGDNDRGWTMTFDFITTKNKLLKLIEGGYEYDNK